MNFISITAVKEIGKAHRLLTVEFLDKTGKVATRQTAQSGRIKTVRLGFSNEQSVTLTWRQWVMLKDFKFKHGAIET